MSPSQNCQWFLRVQGDSSLPSRIEIGSEPVLFGRDGAQVTHALRAQDVSRRHMQAQVDNDGSLLVRDLGSSNGTFVSELQIHGTVAVRPGEEIRVGRWRFEAERVEVEAKAYKNRLPGREKFEQDLTSSGALSVDADEKTSVGALRQGDGAGA